MSVSLSLSWGARGDTRGPGAEAEHDALTLNPPDVCGLLCDAPWGEEAIRRAVFLLVLMNRSLIGLTKLCAQ